jgi:hypothetical protein
VADAVLETLRQWDRPRYLALLLAPPESRAGLLALHAFSAEIGRIAATVSEPQLGEIRLQWWRDSLSAIADGETAGHPVAAALTDAVRRHRLPMAPLRNLVDAHQHDLYADQFANVEALEMYLGSTQSVLIQLSALILDPAAAPDVAEAAGYAGVAYGIGQILMRPGSARNLFPLNTSVETLVDMAWTRLQQAQSLIIPDNLFPAFRHVATTDLFLGAAPPSLLRLQWRLWRARKL